MFVLFYTFVVTRSVHLICSVLLRSVGLFYGSVTVNLRAKVFLQSKHFYFYPESAC